MTGIEVAEMIDRGDLGGLGKALRNALSQMELMTVQMRTHAGDALSLQKEIDGLREQEPFPSPHDIERLCQRIALMAFDCHTARLIDIRNKLAARAAGEMSQNNEVVSGINSALDQLDADRAAILKDVTHAMWAHQLAGTLYIAEATRKEK